MRRIAFALTALIVTAAFAVPAFAKLPPLSDEAKAKAAETAAKTAWSDKVGAYQLCQSMDRVADQYRKSTKAAGKEPAAAVETPPCSDPGPYAPPTTEQRPLEAAGAHSPPGPATAPPNSKATEAELNGSKKK